MIKLIVSDIDGTLVPEGTNDVNPEIFPLIRSLRAIAYCGSKIMKLIRTFIRWIKTHKIVSTIPKVVPIKKKPSAEVVNVF